MEIVRIPSFDGFMLACDLYRPNQAKALVQIIHGAAENKGRYQQVAEFLCERGCCVLSSDIRGHGESVDAPFVRGYMPNVDVLVEDQWVLTKFLKDLHPGLPLTVLAHSFGSNIARIYLGIHADELASLVLTGTPFPVPGIKLAMAFVRFLMAIFGGHSYGWISTKLTTSADLKWVCSDPQVVRERLSDPYRKNFRYPLKSVYTIFDSIYKLKECPVHPPIFPDLPILSITGGKDPVSGGEKGRKLSREALLAWGYRNLQERVYPPLLHEVLMELGKEQVFSLILFFLEQGTMPPDS